MIIEAISLLRKKKVKHNMIILFNKLVSTEEIYKNKMLLPIIIQKNYKEIIFDIIRIVI